MRRTKKRLAVLPWIERRHVARLNPDTRRLVRALLRADPRDGAEDVAARIGVPYGTVRSRLQKKRLPPAAEWRALGRALYLADLARANPDANTTDLARAAGYGDHSGLVHALRRTCGATVSEIRARRYRTWLLRNWWANQSGGER